MTNIEKLEAVIEFLKGDMDGLPDIPRYSGATPMLAEVRKQLREKTRTETVIENLRSHKDLGSFRGEWAIQCGSLIRVVQAGDVIVDYKDGERKILKKQSK